MPQYAQQLVVTLKARGTATRVLIQRFGKLGALVLSPPRNRCCAMPTLPALGSCQNRHRNNTLGRLDHGSTKKRPAAR